MRSNLPELSGATSTARILCADDNTLVGEALAKLFSVNGYIAKHVRGGAPAAEAVLKDVAYFNVLITEHEMTALNGTALARLVRGAGYQGRIIVHGQRIGRKDRAQYDTLGVELVVPKRGEADELLRVVEKFHGE